MSTGLLQQLADYGVFHDEEQGYIDVDDVFVTGNAVPPSDTALHVAPRRSSRFGVWVAIAAAALTVLLIGVIPFLVNNDGTQPADTVVATTLAESAPTTVTESTPTTLGESVPKPGTWSIVPTAEGGLGEGVIRSVAVGGPGLVAVGSTAYDHGDPALWTSVDGIAWTQVPLDEEAFGDGGPMSVIAAGPGLVAVGEGVWTSVDGFDWDRVPDEEGIFEDAGLTSVTVGGPGLVAVGVVAGGEFDNAAVWTSVDGIVWTRVPHDEATFGERSPGVDLTMSHVTVGGPGLVAVGMDWSGPDANAAVWTSVDGLNWTRVPHDEEVFGGSGHQAISGVTAAGPGLVAVGTTRSPQQAVVWTSVDGLTWTRVARDENGSLDGGQMNRVVVADSGLVAVGWIGWIGGPNSVAAVWTSPNGIVWSRVAHDEEAIGNGLMWDLVNTDRGLMAVGSDGTNAVVWVGPKT